MIRILTMILGFIICFSIPLKAASKGSKENPLKVAVVLVKPFALKKEEDYTGFAVDLWREIAFENRWHYKFIDFSDDNFAVAMNATANGTYDVLLGPTAATSERRESMDFSTPFYIDSISPIVKVSVLDTIIKVVESFFYSVSLLLLLLSLSFLIHIHFIWFFERKNGHIPSKYLEGISFVFWRHFTKSSYIGDDKIKIPAPETVHVRISLLVWVISTYVLTTLISGVIVSFMTVSLSKSISVVTSLDQLQKIIVGAAKNSASAQECKRLGLKVREYDNVETGLEDVENYKIGAFITNQSVANYFIQTHVHPRLRISPLVLKYATYGYAFPKGSHLLKDVNNTLEKTQRNGDAEDLCREYLPRNHMNCDL